MCYYQKSLMYAYPYIDENIEQIEKTVLYKALSSCSAVDSTMAQIEKITDLIYKKNQLIELKGVLDGVLRKLSEEERILVGYKYFGEIPPEGFDVTSRTYFRHQVKVLERLGILLVKHGLPEDVFLKEYSGIWFLKHYYNKQKRLYEQAEEIKKKKANDDTYSEKKSA